MFQEKDNLFELKCTAKENQWRESQLSQVIRHVIKAQPDEHSEY